MKKVFLVVAMVFLATVKMSALADEKEILFRNIPWDTSTDDFLYSLYINDNIQIMDMCAYAAIGLSDWNAELTFNNDDSIYVKNGGIEFTLSNPTDIDGENIDLAGYSISDIDMYFMYKNSGEGISLEPADAIFYKAIYRMKVVNTKDVYNDLVKKMTSIYGTPKKNKETRKHLVLNAKDYVEYKESAQWIGNNKTTVYVVRNYRIYEDSKTESEAQLKVVYTRTDATAELKNLQINLDKEARKKEREKAEKNKNNYNGL